MSQDQEVTNLINQAKNQVRKDNIKKFFQKRAKQITLLLGSFIVLAIIFSVFNFYNNAKKAKFSEIFHQSLIDQQLGNLEKSKDGLKEIYESKSAPSGVKSLASLRYAGILLFEGKKDQAIKIYGEINKCNFCDSYIKDLAGLLEIKLLLLDEVAKKDEILSKIIKIEKSSKDLKPYILEQKALFEMKNGNLKKSYDIFEDILKNEKTPKNLKDRVEIYSKMLIKKGALLDQKDSKEKLK